MTSVTVKSFKPLLQCHLGDQPPPSTDVILRGPNEAFYEMRIGNYERWQWEQFKGILSRTHNNMAPFSRKGHRVRYLRGEV